LQQVGTLGELLRKPTSEFVARFMRCENIFSAEVIGPGVRDSDTRVKLDDFELQIAGRHSGKLMLMIRPENVIVRPDSEYSIKRKNVIRTRFVRSRDCGGYVRVDLDGPVSFVAHMTHAAFADLQKKHQPDVLAELDMKNIHLLPR